MFRYAFALLLAGWLHAGVTAETPTAENPAATLPPHIVTAARMPQSPGQTAATVDEFSTATLTQSPSLALDDALRGSAAFSLFRRSSSLIANPTAQGVSLRGLGPSGTSRSLVMLDGIPLNDPFGGWVAWTKIPRLTLTRAEIVRGGGSGVWGNAALGGAVQLFTPPPDTAGGSLSLEAGSFRTARGEVVTGFSDDAQTHWQFGGRWFRTDGPMQYAPEQRGPIDQPFASEHTLGHASFSTQFDSGLRLSAGARFFEEERGNGTPFQRNRSRENAINARLVGEVRPGLALDVLVYGQRQHFASGFSSVDATRTTETPSLDQFDVPATAWGGAVVTTWGQQTTATTVLGADARAVTGETREDFFYSAGTFLRRRYAGGDQTTAGIFAAHQRELTAGLTVSGAARLDEWSNRDGHRREWTKATGAVLRDDSFDDTSGTEFSPSLGFTWRQSPELTWRASVYRAFRAPTLNELYRPFRVGNVATEANPALRREVVTGGEVGFELAHAAWRARANIFQNDLRDGVANVTLSSTPALTQRQRLNLDAIRVRGFEAGLGWNVGRTISVALDYLLTDARVEEAAVAPTLVGRQLAQVPRHTATLRVSCHPDEAWSIDATARAVSEQFEDDENTLALAPAFTVDIAVRRTLSARHEVYAAVENVFNARVETARTNAGLVSLAPGRVARAGWTVHW